MNKYMNRKVNGFDSKKEFKRYEELRWMELSGEIKNLKKQVPFELIPAQRINGKVVERACKYIADFTYEKDGQLIVEDVKSPYSRKLPEYVIKRKLLLWIWKIRINEV